VPTDVPRRAITGTGAAPFGTIRACGAVAGRVALVRVLAG
jgi:hypothetical protein